MNAAGTRGEFTLFIPSKHISVNVAQNRFTPCISPASYLEGVLNVLRPTSFAPTFLELLEMSSRLMWLEEDDAKCDCGCFITALITTLTMLLSQIYLPFIYLPILLHCYIVYAFYASCGISHVWCNTSHSERFTSHSHYIVTILYWQLIEMSQIYITFRQDNCNLRLILQFWINKEEGQKPLPTVLALILTD